MEFWIAFFPPSTLKLGLYSLPGYRVSENLVGTREFGGEGTRGSEVREGERGSPVHPGHRGLERQRQDLGSDTTLIF